MSKSKNSNSSVSNIIRNKPVAKFWYKGSHSKPVRRTLVITELTRDTISGYEVREGRETRMLESSNFKTFTREKMVDMNRFPITESF